MTVEIQAYSESEDAPRFEQPLSASTCVICRC